MMATFDSQALQTMQYRKKSCDQATGHAPLVKAIDTTSTHAYLDAATFS